MKIKTKRKYLVRFITYQAIANEIKNYDNVEVS